MEQTKTSRNTDILHTKNKPAGRKVTREQMEEEKINR
jgi:hypothetical protein